jgi:hypothetical protein
MSLQTIVGRYDGSDYAGLGSILQIQQHAYAYAKLNNHNFYFPGFTNLCHWQYTAYQTQVDYCNALTAFFNFPSEESSTDDVYMIDEGYLIKEWGEVFLKEKKQPINQLAHLIQYNGPVLLKENQINVAVHVRSFNPEDTDKTSYRELYEKESLKDRYFTNILTQLTTQLDIQPNILLYCQGDPQDYEHYRQRFNVDVRVNSDILETLYHLIFSDLLITSNSALSWVAHLYGYNKAVISRDNHSHSWYPDTIIADANGQLNNIQKLKSHI